MNSRAFAYPEIKKARGTDHTQRRGPLSGFRSKKPFQNFTLHSPLSALNLRSYSLILDLFQLERRSSISTGNISSLPMIMSRVRQILLATLREA